MLSTNTYYGMFALGRHKIQFQRITKREPASPPSTDTVYQFQPRRMAWARACDVCERLNRFVALRRRHEMGESVWMSRFGNAMVRHAD